MFERIKLYLLSLVFTPEEETRERIQARYTRAVHSGLCPCCELTWPFNSSPILGVCACKKEGQA
jgi:hypothetical protein